MHLPQAHDHKTRNIFIFSTTNGWWGFIVAFILAVRLYTHRLGVITFRSAFRRFNGANSSQTKIYTIGSALERAWGKRNEWSLRNGNEYFPKPWGAEVNACNVGKMKCRVSGETTAEPGTKWS